MEKHSSNVNQFSELTTLRLYLAFLVHTLEITLQSDSRRLTSERRDKEIFMVLDSFIFWCVFRDGLPARLCLHKEVTTSVIDSSSHTFQEVRAARGWILKVTGSKLLPRFASFYLRPVGEDAQRTSTMNHWLKDVIKEEMWFIV